MRQQSAGANSSLCDVFKLAQLLKTPLTIFHDSIHVHSHFNYANCNHSTVCNIYILFYDNTL